MTTAGGALLANPTEPQATPLQTMKARRFAYTTLQASGTNSVLDLSALASLHGGTGDYSFTSIIAQGGGQINLSGWITDAGGVTQIQATGAGSVVDISSLPTFLSDGYNPSGLNAASSR